MAVQTSTPGLAGPQPYRLHDIRFDQAWILAVDLGKLLSTNAGRDQWPLLAQQIEDALHPESVHHDEHPEPFDESRAWDFPKYIAEFHQALELVPKDPAAAAKALGQVCWEIYLSHPKQFSRKYLRKAWKRKPEQPGPAGDDSE
jgi:hypothetical protein